MEKLRLLEMNTFVLNDEMLLPDYVVVDFGSLKYNNIARWKASLSPEHRTFRAAASLQPVGGLVVFQAEIQGCWCQYYFQTTSALHIRNLEHTGLKQISVEETQR
jgi:hypothetical protein